MNLLMSSKGRWAKNAGGSSVAIIVSTAQGNSHEGEGGELVD